MHHAVEHTKSVAAALERTYEATLAMPLPIVAGRRYGPIAPIIRVDGQSGDWSSPGESRTLILSDGGRLRETLLNLEPPNAFRYQLSDFKGPLALLVTHIDGEFTFTPEAATTRIVWRYTMHARSRLSSLLLPPFGMVWRGYARQILDNLDALLQG